MKKTVVILAAFAVLSITGWVAAGPMSSPMGPEIRDLGDVSLSNLTNGQVLKYNSSVKRWENGSDTGGVAGPGSSTNGYIVLWDGTGGDTIKDSAVDPATLAVISHYEEKTIFAGSMLACTTNPAAMGTTELATNDIMLVYYAFDGGATEEHVNFSMVLPPEWDRSTFKVKFIWASATGSTAGDTVEWGIRAVAVSDNDALDATWGTAVTVSDTLLADNGADNQTSAATGALTVGGTPAAGDLIFFDVYRNTDGTDDMAEDAWLIAVIIQPQYTTQTTSGW